MSSSLTAQGDAGAGLDEQLATLELERLLQADQEPVRNVHRVRDVVDVLQQNGELVAAKTRRGVRWAHTSDDALGQGNQELVTDGVAETVVDRLEIIEVDVQDPNARAASPPESAVGHFLAGPGPAGPRQGPSVRRRRR